MHGRQRTDTDDAWTVEARAKLSAAREEAQSMCQAFFDAVLKDKADYERALEGLAKKAEAEREAEGGGDDDHDNRKLKKADRMRLVLKNKEEGNELFGGGNVKPAAARYVKALTHASKFFDLSPEDEEEVRKVKVGLLSNVALCYFKLGNVSCVWVSVSVCVPATKRPTPFIHLVASTPAHTARRHHPQLRGGAEAGRGQRQGPLPPRDGLPRPETV